MIAIAMVEMGTTNDCESAALNSIDIMNIETGEVEFYDSLDELFNNIKDEYNEIYIGCVNGNFGDFGIYCHCYLANKRLKRYMQFGDVAKKKVNNSFASCATFVEESDNLSKVKSGCPDASVIAISTILNNKSIILQDVIRYTGQTGISIEDPSDMSCIFEEISKYADLIKTVKNFLYEYGIEEAHENKYLSTSQISKECYLKTISKSKFEDKYKMLGSNKLLPDLLSPSINKRVKNRQEDTPNLEDFYRKAQRVGYMYLNERYRSASPEEIVENGISLDVNSLYPWALSENFLPYGGGEHYTYWKGPIPDMVKHSIEVENKDYMLFVARFKVTLAPGNWNRPFLKHDEDRGINSRSIISCKDEILTLCSVDYYLMFKCYEVIKCECIEGFWTIGTKEKLRIKEYFDGVYEKKCKSSGAERNFYKSILNAFIGQLAKIPKDIAKINCKADGTWFSERGRKYERNIFFRAPAVFAYAYARKYIIECGQLFGDRLIYTNVDSLHIADCTEAEARKILPIDDKKIGCFKIEHKWDCAQYVNYNVYVIANVDKKTGEIIPEYTISGLTKEYIPKDFPMPESIRYHRCGIVHIKNGFARYEEEEESYYKCY